MSAQDYSKEFTRLKNAIGMSNNKVFYLFRKKLSFEMKNFLAHHELTTEFDPMFKEVIKWSAKVKQLLSWAKPQNPASLPANVIKENRTPLKGPRRDPQRTDPQGGWRIPTLNRRETTLNPTWTLYVLWQSGTFSQGLPSLAKVQPPISLLASSFNKEPSQSYALLLVKLGSAKTSQEVKALLDTGAMGSFISSSLAQQLGLQEGPSAWVTLANKSHTRVTKIEGNLGVMVGNNQFDIMVSSLSNLAFPLILASPGPRPPRPY
ncbi:hypothetical protein DSO57_1030649 [Entomophthora muscae]|uniref:Uncharacterized protein n=1 Tax=Entomophthora muscae TaxID=34485 RepID=A0ACC2T0R8_9FUNG|nr:hypothetical protein DSO57_1030649 [Entomophthora muscae]